jgi:hypothetical protein
MRPMWRPDLMPAGRLQIETHRSSPRKIISHSGVAEASVPEGAVTFLLPFRLCPLWLCHRVSAGRAAASRYHLSGQVLIPSELPLVPLCPLHTWPGHYVHRQQWQLIPPS